jgi:ABC-type transport system substrate-binding protein
MAGFHRRELLTRVGLLGVGTLLAACTPAPGAIVPTQSSAAPTASSGQPGQAAPTSAAAPVPATPQGATAARTTTVVYAVSSNPATLNPLLDDTGASQSGYELMFEGLVKPDPKTGTPVPSLATSWDQSGDGLKWTFHMRPNVTWHDGQPFTADDVLFTWEYATDPATAAFTRGHYEGIRRLDKLDDHTVKVVFTEPTPTWFASGYLVDILPKHRFAEYKGANARNAPYNLMPVGTGAYKIVDFTPGEVALFEINPHYGCPRRRP